MKSRSVLLDAFRALRQRSAGDGGIGGTIRRALTAAGLHTAAGPMAGVNDTIRRALSLAGQAADAPARVDSSHGHARDKPGHFLSRSYSNAAGTRAYKLYVPGRGADELMPLVVMLHGCTQDPDDFAAGTHMNELADREGCLVVYPAQSANANGAKCWNWFNPTHQAADRGEPSLIAGITREVASSYPVDPRLIFVAGLSAGAAMAVVLGATYPELFAAVGAHSGLPYGAAYDVPSAFAAMRGGADPRARGGARDRSSRPQTVGMGGTPTIVFHGDQDTTVNAMNGSRIVSQALALAESSAPLTKTVQARKSVNGREYTTTIYHDASRHSRLEEWILHGAGHAWSGGSADGSFSDVTGPDASAEMYRFFMAQHPRSAQALR